MARQLVRSVAIPIWFSLLFIPIESFAQQINSAPRKEVTLETIFGGGDLGMYPEPVTWNPAGTELTYLHRQSNGKTELWSIDAGTGKRQIIVSAEKMATMAPPASIIEDAVERERRTRYGVAAYHWSPDSRQILFDANGRLWCYDLHEEKARELPNRADAIDPKYSPDGKYISYLMAQDLFVRAVQSGEEKDVTQSATPKDVNQSGEILNGMVDWLYEEELGVRSNYAWSPDSSQIAFLQTDLRGVPSHPIVDYDPTHPTVRMEKYPLAGDALPAVRLGVVAASGGTIGWIDLNTGNAYLPRFGWVKSGLLYATVVDRKQQKADLYFIDAITGKSKLVLSETSDAYIEVETRLQFLPVADGRFLWMSWRDGFNHIYVYSFDREHPLAAEAKFERQLTHGSFEVSAIAGINGDNGTVFYQSNEGDDRQQHLYSMRLDGSATRRLTEESGYNTANFNPQGTMYVRTYSQIDRPPERLLCSIDTSCRVLDPPSPALADYDIRTPEFLDFAAEDGTLLHGMLYLPRRSEGKNPLVLAPYGGPGAQLVQDQWSPNDLFDLVLANKGIAVLVVDNRGMSNRGRRFGSAQRLKMGEVELRDQLAALNQLLVRYPQLDSSRIGFWGWSYGGFMALYAMTHSDRFIAGCAGSPVADWRLYDATYVERFMGLVSENKVGYDRSSNLLSAGKLKGHLLITHGLSDVNVHPQNTVKMTDELIRAGIPFDMMLYPKQTHHFNDEAELHVFQKFVDHFVRYLQPGLGPSGGS